MNHAPSGGVASSSTTPASIRRARGPDAPLPIELADGTGWSADAIASV
jgi:hypothetical protein